MMKPTPTLVALGGRQIWSTPTSHGRPPHCTAFNLPANGVLVLNSTATITLETNAVYQPFCTDFAVVGANGTLPISEFQDPFVSSTIPQIFVLGAMLVVAWILVIILIITPRTSLVAGGFRNLMGSKGGPASIIGSGGRPWLQKAAALTVFVSLLIATVNSFWWASYQYNAGYEDATALTVNVVGSLEIRIIRVISDTFLWLAQVQTLIRLFPRHKEKVIIKWTGFALITLDTIFSILDNFVVQGDSSYVKKPQNFNSAVSALWYLFQLALSVVYMASVLYYSIVKRRFAYFHHKMRNICVVALLSIIAVAIPVVFFVVDIANWQIIGWGDYVRWVGAAAASVVVWEWVERIEALEREERKDGILGREIFEGDEMISSRNWSNLSWPKRRRRGGGTGDGSSGSGSGSGSGSRSRSGAGEESGFSSGGSMAVHTGRIRSAFLARIPAVHHPLRNKRATQPQPPAPSRLVPTGGILGTAMPPSNELPPIVASPVSRSDTTSAASTVYAVIHHPVQDPATFDADQILTPINSGVVHNNTAPEVSADPSPAQPFQPSTRSTPSDPQTQPSATEDTPAQPPIDRPLHSRLGRPFRHGDTVTASHASASSASSPASSANVPSPTPTPPGKSSSRGRFRLRRTVPEPSVDLPLYVIRGGGNGGEELVVEQQSSGSQHVASAGEYSNPPTPNNAGYPRSNLPDDPHAARLPSIDNAISSRTPPQAGSQSRDSPSPIQRMDGINGPPPPFSASTSAPPPPTGQSTSSGDLHQPPPTVSPAQRANANGSRHSRRSPLGMPPLVEGETDGSEPTGIPSPAYQATEIPRSDATARLSGDAPAAITA